LLLLVESFGDFSSSRHCNGLLVPLENRTGHTQDATNSTCEQRNALRAFLYRQAAR